MTRPSQAAHADDHHAALHAGFRWQVPPDFGIAEACCGRWARSTPDAVAIRYETEDGQVRPLRYAELQREADRLSRALRRLGVQAGDRVAIVMPQRPETAIAHVAVYQLGAIAMPLTQLFGPEALAYRLQHGEARLAIVDESAVDALLAARADCAALTQVIAVGAAAGRGDLDWTQALGQAGDGPFDPAPVQADDAAVLIYTSGTTGPPKGALIPHRALIGNLSGFVCSQNWFGTDPATGRRPAGAAPVVFWSPADWAWTGGLMDALLPTLYFGHTIVAVQGRFDPVKAFALMARHRVTHSFLFPTALKAMMKAVPDTAGLPPLALEAIMSAGEAVGDAVFAYCEQQLGVTVNEMFGQTEINYLVGNCAMNGRRGAGAGWPARPGSMGRAYPGHRIAVIDDAGRVCPPGVPGDVALHRRDVHGDPDPIFFLGYWKNEAATRAKFTGDPADSWCRTGDTATMDADGYLWYQGRSDDVFKAAGYRIGPGEIENCLVKHPAVANAAVVPKPDAARGAVVKAYVVLAPGHVGDAALVDALQQHVRGRLAPYEYPKEIEFIDALPMTTTGKVQRRVLRLQEEARARAAAAAGG
ncbi:acyl-CoA synthetase [Piscinibacter sakaiensis]|uniref:Acetyl-coenzyme A synthetase n=1 Tax=Piscinibacter sakaiensis TaxID=1547922 RepID=A0A0K8P3H0_PISS1|nr:AMP-binding protein [Piscinibacter sakaiensis]GAP37114.1 acetyl-coenzyme A synthetase [Piscinibacter sakaiensis]